MPEIFISIFDGKAATGLYGNASKLTYLPLSLLAAAVGQVFYERIARLKEDKNASAQISMELFDFLWMVGIIPVAVVAVWGQDIFPWILGSEWEMAGAYAEVLIFFYFSMFLTSSFSSAFEAYNKLSVQLIYNLSFLLITSGAMFASYSMGYDTLQTLTIFTVIGAIMRVGILNYFFELFGKSLLFRTVLVLLTTGMLVLLLTQIKGIITG